MTVPEIREVDLIDRSIQSIHQQLGELYERRAEIMKTPATDRHSTNTQKKISDRTLKSLDLSLEKAPKSLAL